jgi:hypothetical protein
VAARQALASGLDPKLMGAFMVTSDIFDSLPPSPITSVSEFGTQCLGDPFAEVGWVGGWRGDAVAFRFQSPPVEPWVRFSRTRLTDALHRRCSISPARPGGAWVR